MHRILLTVLTGAVIGALGVGSAVAGVVAAGPGVAPSAGADALDVAVDRATGGTPQVAVPDVVRVEDAGDVGDPAATAAVASLTTGRLDDGWFRAGAATGSLLPDPDRWVQGGDCTGAPEQLYTPLTPEGCLITFDMRWADGFDEANPNQVRSFAISNGDEVVVLSSLDLVGYMAAYPAGTCDRCGLDEIAQDLSAELGIPAENFSWSSSHTHAAPSTIADGPAWYYDQVAAQLRATARAAIADASAMRSAGSSASRSRDLLSTPCFKGTRAAQSVTNES